MSNISQKIKRISDVKIGMNKRNFVIFKLFTLKLVCYLSDVHWNCLIRYMDHKWETFFCTTVLWTWIVDNKISFLVPSVRLLGNQRKIHFCDAQVLAFISRSLFFKNIVHTCGTTTFTRHYLDIIRNVLTLTGNLSWPNVSIRESPMRIQRTDCDQF